MLATFLRAAATIVTEILAEEPPVLPLYTPKSSPESPLEEIVIIGNDYCVMPRRRNSFFTNNNGAKAPRAPALISPRNR
jgi:hypothetical protein